MCALWRGRCSASAMESIDTLLSELHLSSPAMTSHLWMQTSRLKQIKQVLNEVETWPRVVIQSDSRGVQFIDGERLFGGLQWNGRLEVTFPAQVRDRLIAEEMAVAGPDQSWSDRVVWMIRNTADVERAL